MDLVLDISSSIAFWRQCYPTNRTPKDRLLTAHNAPTPSSELACNDANIRDAISRFSDYSLLAADNRCHTVAFSEQNRRDSSIHSVHVWNGRIPTGSFFEFHDGVFLESPECMFMRAATILDLVSLIAFGDELCGYFSFDPRDKRGFRKRLKPLTSKAQLERYLTCAQGCRGLKRAKVALPFVIENCASPMEVFDEMTMCLPYRYGGYGIPRPEMNLLVPLNERAMRIAKREKCYLDMGWRRKSLDVEHHGKLDHSSVEDRASDRARVNGLKEMGYEVIELTYDQIDDLIAYEHIICRISRILGKRIHKQYLGATSERIALRKGLSAWNASSGTILQKRDRYERSGS